MRYHPVVLDAKDVETGEHWSPRDMNEFELYGVENYMNEVLETDDFGDFTIYSKKRLYLDNPQMYSFHLPEMHEGYRRWNLIHLFLTGKETLVAQIAHPDDDECDYAVYVRLY